MSEYLTGFSMSNHALGDMTCTVIANPERALADQDKDPLAARLRDVMIETTGVHRDVAAVRRYAYGLPDRGRVLCLFKNGEELVGFNAFHLLNDGKQLLRHNGETVLHLGSGHIRPSFQGRKLALESINLYLGLLDDDVRPTIVEGFTQSPRLLRLVHHSTNPNMFPTITDSGESAHLADMQHDLLPVVTGGLKDGVTVRNRCIVSGLKEQVYSDRIYSKSPFDSLVYDQLGLQPERGEFVHFIARLMPRRIQTV